MKRYTKRPKTVKVSKRKLETQVKALQQVVDTATKKAEWAGQHHLRAKEALMMESCRARGLHEEVVKLREKLEKVTEPVWKHARVVCDPPPEMMTAEIRRLWEIQGAANIGISVEFRHVRRMPGGDREAFLERLVEDFTRKAREHAVKNFRVLLD